MGFVRAVSKAPQNLPTASDRVRMRGRPYLGELVGVNPESLWAVVCWDWEGYLTERPPPLICHLYELQKESP